MKLQTLPSEFLKASSIIKELQQAGYEAYFVGGSVRDALLNRPIHDVDIATSAYPEEVKAVFKKTFDVGIEHGTVLVLSEGEQYEVTTFRTESTYTDFRRPDSVAFVSDLTEDLKRRDFTINAFAMTAEGEIIDHFDGLLDLSEKRLRAVGKAQERFSEDALRIMRAMRFAAELDFEIEPLTFEAMKSHANLLKKIAIERIFVEMNKLLAAKKWRRGLTFLIESEAWNFLPDFGKPSFSDLEKDFSFKCPEQAWAWLILQFAEFDFKKWKVSNDFHQKTSKILSAYEEENWSLRLIYKYGLEIAGLVDDLKLAQGHQIEKEQAVRLNEELQIHDKSEIVVKGTDLIKKGYLPGPQLGQILSDIENQIVNNKLKNNKEEVLSYVEKIS